MRNILATLFVFLAGGCTLRAGTLIALDPLSGNVQASAGSDAGWGFIMTSDPTLFISAIQSGLIGQSNSSLGVYTDFIGAEGGPFNGVLAAGAAAWIQSFDDISTGVGAFTIDPAAQAGTTDSGSIEIQFAIFSADPNGCGSCTVGIQTLDLPFQVTVGPDVSTTSTPEPSSLWMLSAAGGLMGLLRLRNRQIRKARDNLGWRVARKSICGLRGRTSFA